MIRPLTLAHAAAVQDIVQSIAELGVPGAPRWTLEQTASELRSGRALGVFDESTFLRAFVLYRSSCDLREITYLATSPKAFRRGLMAQLLRAFLKLEGGEVWLEVHRDNRPARTLYESLGWKAAGMRRRYYSDGGDAILYSWSEGEGPPASGRKFEA